MLIVLALLVACTTSNTVTKPVATAEPSGDAKNLLYGDDAFKKRLADALAAKGPEYEPRTKHKNEDGSPKYTNRLIQETDTDRSGFIDYNEFAVMMK